MCANCTAFVYGVTAQVRNTRMTEFYTDAPVIAVVPVLRASESHAWPTAYNQIRLQTSQKAFLSGAPVGCLDDKIGSFVGVCAADETQLNITHSTMGVTVKALSVIVAGSFVLNHNVYVVVPGKGLFNLTKLTGS